MLVALLGSGFLLGDMFGTGRTRKYFTQQAIDHGCAEYVVDAKTGEVEFVWKGKDER
jgi:hypothetical protein